VGPKSNSRRKVGRDIKKVKKHWSKGQFGDVVSATGRFGDGGRKCFM